MYTVYYPIRLDLIGLDQTLHYSNAPSLSFHITVNLHTVMMMMMK